MNEERKKHTIQKRPGSARVVEGRKLNERNFNLSSNQ